MPKVSIIIPLYNQKEFVGQAIESVLNQSFADKEVIVVDDGSTDNPEPILKAYESEIKVVTQPNKGLAGARNAGIKCAQGDYVQFLDADDVLHRDKLRLQLEFMVERNASVSYCEIVQFHQSTKKTELKYVGEVKDPFPSLYNEWFTYPFPIHSLLFKREIFHEYGLFPEDLKASEDRYFLSLLALRGEKFHYFPFIGGFRRRHKKNMTKERLHIYRNMIKYYQKINALPEASAYIGGHFSFSGKEMMSANLTYMFFKDVKEGVPIAEIVRIKRLLKKHGISFFYEPIPLFRSPLKGFSLFLHSVFYRIMYR